MATDTNTTKIVGLLVEASKLDTVYRDLYLKRARQLLALPWTNRPIGPSGHQNKRSKIWCDAADRRHCSETGAKRPSCQRRPMGCANGKRP